MDKIMEIKKLTTDFRNAIESMDTHEFGESEWFSHFPRGCCGDTSDLLSKYLMSNGIKAFYVSGTDRGQTHAWLEYNDYIIDITADQFPDISEKVLVTNNRQWHLRFKNQKKEYHDIEDIEVMDKSHSDRLRGIYNNIIFKIGKC